MATSPGQRRIIDVSSARGNTVLKQANPICNLTVEQEVFIQTELTNNQKKDQEVRFIVQIKDSGNLTAFLTSKRIMLPPLTSLTIDQPWIPATRDQYSIETMVWQNFENPVPLAEPEHLQERAMYSGSCIVIDRSAEPPS